MSFFSSKKQKGFTLIEMLVVIAIVGILVAIFIGPGLRDSNTNVRDDTAINEILLSFREVQSWGTSSREFPSGSGDFDAGFGIFLEKNSDKYILFGDLVNGNKKNRYENENEKIEEKVMTASFTLSKICAGNDKDNLDCSLNEIHFVYRRPSLGPIITISHNGSSVENAEIHITNSAGVEKKLVISSFGKLYKE